MVGMFAWILPSLPRGASGLAVVAALGLAACGGGGGAASAPASGNAAVTVAVSDMAFKPGAVTVDAGQAVAWEWDDEPVHDVAFDDGRTSPKQNRGSWERTFDRPGDYRYVCTLHPNMKGTVTVR